MYIYVIKYVIVVLQDVVGSKQESPGKTNAIPCDHKQYHHVARMGPQNEYIYYIPIDSNCINLLLVSSGIQTRLAFCTQLSTNSRSPRSSCNDNPSKNHPRFSARKRKLPARSPSWSQ